MATYSDNFNRASLGADWTQDSGAWSINSSIVLNQTTAGASYRKLRYSAAAMDSTDVESEVDGESPSSGVGFGAYARGSGSGTVTYYAMQGFGGDVFYLVEITAGAETILASGGTCTANTLYNLRIRVNGSAIEGYVNDVLTLSTTDSSLTGNDVGCMSFGVINTTTDAYIDNWAAADLAPSTTPPNWQANGTAASGIGAVSPAWPAHQTNDIGLLIVESAGGEAATLSTSAGFVEVADSPQSTGTGTAGTRVTVFWARATSNAMATPTVADPGNHAHAIIITFRGCITTGNPWDVTAGSTKATASTSASAPGDTTTVDNCLVVNIIARDTDSAAAAFSAWANADLTSVTERYDAGTTQGNGGGLGVATGVRAAAGAFGATTATVSSSINASLTIALLPVPLATTSMATPVLFVRRLPPAMLAR